MRPALHGCSLDLLQNIQTTYYSCGSSAKARDCAKGGEKKHSFHGWRLSARVCPNAVRAQKVLRLGLSQCSKVNSVDAAIAVREMAHVASRVRPSDDCALSLSQPARPNRRAFFRMPDGYRQ